MQRYHKKMAAPVVIAIILLAYFGWFLRVSLWQPVPPWSRIILLAVPLFLMGVTVFVLVERIKEIRGGDEDDLGKY